MTGSASGDVVRVLVIEHEDDAPAAWFGRWLSEAGAELDVRRPYLGQDLPTDLGDHDALLVLGGDMVPPALTLGPLGSAERLNWLAKNRRQKTWSHRRTVSRSYAVRRSSGNPAGHSPAVSSCQACQARKAILLGR